MTGRLISEGLILIYLAVGGGALLVERFFTSDVKNRYAIGFLVIFFHFWLGDLIYPEATLHLMRIALMTYFLIQLLLPYFESKDQGLGWILSASLLLSSVNLLFYRTLLPMIENIAPMGLPILWLLSAAVVFKQQGFFKEHHALYIVPALFYGLPFLQTYQIVADLTLIIIGLFVAFKLLNYHIQRHDTLMREVAEIKDSYDRAVNMEARKRTLHYEMQKEKMAEINRTDALTKALTRQGIASVSDELIAQKTNEAFCLLIFDIDHFKNLNDYYGHILGDKVLRLLVTTLKKEMRDGDVIGRYGGDEFIILLPKIDKRSAYRTAERFRMTISKTEDPHFTISMGMAFYPDDGKHFEELVHYADLGLYKAKEKGRNRVGYAGTFD